LCLTFCNDGVKVLDKYDYPLHMDRIIADYKDAKIEENGDVYYGL
jgi:hypothetical protein